MIPRWGTLVRSLTARRRRMLIDDGTLQRIMAVYGSEKLLSQRTPRGGQRSRSAILDTPNGPKILKQYTTTLDEPSIRFEHEVLSFLAQAGFRAPRVLPSRDGSTLVTVNGRHYALFDFVDGFRYIDFYWSRQREHGFLAQAGRALAGLHRATDGFRPEGSKVDGFTPDGDRPWRDHRWYMAELRRRAAEIRSQPNRDGFERFVLEQMGRVQHSLEVLGARVESHHSALPKLVIHGDYGPYNLLFNRHGLAAVLDFECTRLDLRAYDLLFALYRFAGTSDGSLNLGNARIFYTAYRTEFPLTRAEIELAPDLLRLTCVRGVAKSVISRAANKRGNLEGVSRLMGLWDWLATASVPFREMLDS
jgi:homoserine kinase type II